MLSNKHFTAGSIKPNWGNRSSEVEQDWLDLPAFSVARRHWIHTAPAGMEAMGVMLLMKNTEELQLCGLNLSVMTKRGLQGDGGLSQLYRLYMKVEEIEPQGSVMDRDRWWREFWPFNTNWDWFVPLTFEHPNLVNSINLWVKVNVCAEFEGILLRRF